MYDAVIAGAGPAGLTAALNLGRLRRNVLVADTNQPRNAVTHAAHGFFTRDGVSPGQLRHIGRDQLKQYASVRIQSAGIRFAYRNDDHLVLTIATDEVVHSKALVIATGVHDELPRIDGLAEHWGRGIFSCPHCDGWENRDQPIALLNTGNEVDHRLSMLHNLSRDLTLLTNSDTSLDHESVRRVEERGIRIVTEPIGRVEGNGDRLERIVFDSGYSVPLHALFISTTMHPRKRARPAARLRARDGRADAGNGRGRPVAADNRSRCIRRRRHHHTHPSNHPCGLVRGDGRYGGEPHVGRV